MEADSSSRGLGARSVGGVGRRRLVRGALVGLTCTATATAAACALPGSAGEKATNSRAPAVAKVLLMANPLFTSVQAELVAAQAEVDPGLKLDMSVFPGQIALFREKLVTIYAGGDAPDVQWVHPSVVSLFGSKKLLRPLDDFARKDRETALFAQLPEFGKSMLPWENKDVWLESMATARALTQPASYNDIASMWTTTWNDILAQKGTVKSALDEFARQVNAILALEQ